MVATANIEDIQENLGDCDVNLEAETPEFRLYKAGTGVCLESPDRNFNVSSAMKSEE